MISHFWESKDSKAMCPIFWKKNGFQTINLNPAKPLILCGRKTESSSNMKPTCAQTYHQTLNDLRMFSFVMWLPPLHLEWHLPLETILSQVTGTFSPRRQQFYSSLHIPLSIAECAMHYITEQTLLKFTDGIE